MPKEVAALLAVSLALVDLFDGVRIGECLDSLVESDAVIAQVLGRFRIAPLEILIFHIIRDTRIFCKCLV